MRLWRGEDFDNNGNHRIRKGIWWSLFLLVHPWWLIALDISIAQGEMGVLSAIYPTADELYAGLVCSVSVFVFLFVCPFHHATLCMRWLL